MAMLVLPCCSFAIASALRLVWRAAPSWGGRALALGRLPRRALARVHRRHPRDGPDLAIDRAGAGRGGTRRADLHDPWGCGGPALHGRWRSAGCRGHPDLRSLYSVPLARHSVVHTGRLRPGGGERLETAAACVSCRCRLRSPAAPPSSVWCCAPSSPCSPAVRASRSSRSVACCSRRCCATAIAIVSRSGC